MSDAAVTIFAASEKQTQKLAQALAGLITKGDIVLLNGGLGAGKSLMAHAIIRQLLDQSDL